MKILLIDNYDSFTYNLVQYLAELARTEVSVFRNDKITLAEIRKMDPDCIVISPGPSTPKEAGLSVPIIKEFHPTYPILGVCLGHQSICEAFGGEVVRARNIMHGKTSLIEHDGKTIFKGIPSPFEATRYHSLIAKEPLPSCLEVSARSTDDKYVMGLRHKKYFVEGVQFHPESILTKEGKKLLSNFLEGCK